MYVAIVPFNSLKLNISVGTDQLEHGPKHLYLARLYDRLVDAIP